MKALNPFVFDLDNTLVETFPCIVYGLKMEHGIHTTGNEYIKTVGNMSEKETHSLLCDYVFKYAEHSKPVDYSVDVVGKSMKLFGSVDILTARKRETNADTQDMLHQIYGDDIVFRIFNRDWDEKHPFCEENNVLVFVDDHPHTVQMFDDSRIRIMMPRKPYNISVKMSGRNFYPYDSLEVVKSFMEIYENEEG